MTAHKLPQGPTAHSRRRGLPQSRSAAGCGLADSCRNHAPGCAPATVAGPHLLSHEPGHSRGTDSRHQADLGGHRRTLGHRNLSSGGHLRTRRDTRGHATTTVRDREAPGSNPGPPTNFSIQIRHVSGAEGDSPAVQM